MKRRTYLGSVAALAAGSTVALAGCSTSVGEVSAPAFPDSMGEQWTQIDERTETLFEESVAGTTIEAKARGVVYEDVDLRSAIEDAIGELEHPVALLAGSRVAFSGDLEQALDGDLLDRAEDAVRDRFEDQLAQMGIENVERTETGTITVDTGEEANYRRYVGDLQLDETSGPEVDLDSLPVAGDLASWQPADSMLVVGAAYPAETLSETIERNGGDGSSVDVGYDPAAYRSEIRSIMTAVE